MSWESSERFISKGPVAAILLIAGIGLVGGIVMRGCSAINETAAVAQKEFGASALLRKYEWFKSAAAELDAKRANIEVYGGLLTSPDTTSKDILAMEVAGMKASYNSLAAEYNAQMAKFNWRFTNAGDLPAGATQVLPREFRAYITH